jgi:hypothetical protein
MFAGRTSSTLERSGLPVRRPPTLVGFNGSLPTGIATERRPKPNKARSILVARALSCALRLRAEGIPRDAGCALSSADQQRHQWNDVKDQDKDLKQPEE